MPGFARKETSKQSKDSKGDEKAGGDKGPSAKGEENVPGCDWVSMNKFW
jgi:hypothetical protein